MTEKVNSKIKDKSYEKEELLQVENVSIQPINIDINN